jgi:hypothetical protein
MAPEAQKPSQWLCLTQLPREMYSQPIVHKALSQRIIGKPALTLAEITIRKSQDLALQRHLYAHVFKPKQLGASKEPLTLVADDYKPAVLHGQILATHPSDVVGLIFLRSWSNAESSPLGDVSLGCTSLGRASRPAGRS